MTPRANRLTRDRRLTPQRRSVPSPPVRLAVLLCLVVVLAGAACEPRPSLRARKQQLMKLPIPWRRPSIHISDDGKHATFTVRDASGGYAVVTPEGRGPVYTDVSPPLFAPKSDRVHYLGARDDGGTKRFEVVAGTTPVPVPFVEPIELTPMSGGARWAAIGFIEPVQEGKPDAPRAVAIVVDGRELGRYAAATRPSFSADGGHVAWAARTTTGETVIVVDGAVARTLTPPTSPDDGTPFHGVATVRYLADGRLIALVPDGDSWTVWRGDERLATYGQSFVPDRTILIATPDTKASIVAGSLATAADAPVTVWWERMPGQAERWRVVRDGAAVDGIECHHYWSTQPPVLTDDGAHVAYVCPAPIEPEVPLGRRWVVLDGRRFGPYIESWTLGISPDGTQVAHGAAESLPIDSWRIFVNGMPRTPPEVLVWRPRFSPDGQHVLWAGGPERGRRRISVDARVVTRFDDVVYGPEFPTPHSAVWVIRRGRKLSRIEVSY